MTPTLTPEAAERQVIHDKYVRVGSRVTLMQAVAGIPGSEKSSPVLHGTITKLNPTTAELEIAGTRYKAPYGALMLRPQPGERIDATGRLLDVDMTVIITCYGGNVARSDVGQWGVILALGKEKAKVRFFRNTEQVKNIYFSYLRRE